MKVLKNLLFHLKIKLLEILIDNITEDNEKKSDIMEQFYLD